MNTKERFKKAMEEVPALHRQDLEFIAKLVSLNSNDINDIQTGDNIYVSACVRDSICGMLAAYCYNAQSQEIKQLLKNPDMVMDLIEKSIKDGSISFTVKNLFCNNFYNVWLSGSTRLQDILTFQGYYIDKRLSDDKEEDLLYIHIFDNTDNDAKIADRTKEILMIASRFKGQIMIGLYTNNPTKAMQKYSRISRYTNCCSIDIDTNADMFYESHFFYVNTGIAWWK